MCLARTFAASSVVGPASQVRTARLIRAMCSQLVRRKDRAAFRARFSVAKSGQRTMAREFVPRCSTAATSPAPFVLRDHPDFVIILLRADCSWASVLVHNALHYPCRIP